MLNGRGVSLLQTVSVHWVVNVESIGYNLLPAWKHIWVLLAWTCAVPAAEAAETIPLVLHHPKDDTYVKRLKRTVATNKKFKPDSPNHIKVRRYGRLVL